MKSVFSAQHKKRPRFILHARPLLLALEKIYLLTFFLLWHRCAEGFLWSDEPDGQRDFQLRRRPHRRNRPPPFRPARPAKDPRWVRCKQLTHAAPQIDFAIFAPHAPPAADQTALLLHPSARKFIFKTWGCDILVDSEFKCRKFGWFLGT